MRKLEGRILFIGDNEEICRFVNRVLRGMGCEPLTAWSKTIALLLIPEENPDAIVIDWATKYDRDAEFCRKIRSLVPNTPVLLFTGIASGPEINLEIRALEETSLSLHSMDSQIADLFEGGLEMNPETTATSTQKFRVAH